MNTHLPFGHENTSSAAFTSPVQAYNKNKHKKADSHLKLAAVKPPMITTASFHQIKTNKIGKPLFLIYFPT